MNLHDAYLSMGKSTRALAAAGGVVTLAAIWIRGTNSAAILAGLGLLMLLVAAALVMLAGAGLLTQRRQRRIELGHPDLFMVRNANRSEDAVRDGRVPRWSRLRRWFARRVFGHGLLVGDTVRVKSLAAIRATLDANACLDGLPFMDEMATLCDKTLRVYRVVDKIYDYGRSRLMRRLDNCVLLVDMRCDGSAHAGCEAACYLIWKAAWLDAVAPLPITRPPQQTHEGAIAESSDARLSCQYTQLTDASQSMRQLSLHGLFGPLVVGNVTPSAFLVAAATSCFNAFQSWRGGADYPSKPIPGDDKSIRGETLRSGDWVRIKLPAELARAMDRNSKNRGLWFDRDMLKLAGQVYRVRNRIDKIIDINSGRMISMKTPCIALEGVHTSGEFQNFGEQHDFMYWRETWLNRLTPSAGHGAAPGDPTKRSS